MSLSLGPRGITRWAARKPGNCTNTGQQCRSSQGGLCPRPALKDTLQNRRSTLLSKQCLDQTRTYRMRSACWILRERQSTVLRATLQNETRTQHYYGSQKNRKHGGATLHQKGNQQWRHNGRGQTSGEGQHKYLFFFAVLNYSRLQSQTLVSAQVGKQRRVQKRGREVACW